MKKITSNLLVMLSLFCVIPILMGSETIKNEDFNNSINLYINNNTTPIALVEICVYNYIETCW